MYKKSEKFRVFWKYIFSYVTSYIIILIYFDLHLRKVILDIYNIDNNLIYTFLRKNIVEHLNSF